MSGLPIVLTAQDHVRLEELIQEHLYRGSAWDAAAFDRLAGEIARARVVASDAVPPNIVTMGSTANVRDMESGERFRLTVCWPEEADPQQGRINVLAPLGMALLGSRVGELIEWPMPDGIRRLKINRIVFQPEAATLQGADR